MKIQEMMRKQISRAHELKNWGTIEVLKDIPLEREDLGYHLCVLEDDTLVRRMKHLLDAGMDIAGDRPMNRIHQLNYNN